MNEVIFNNKDIIKIDNKWIQRLKDIANRSPLRKSRLCLHKDIDDPLHEMIIAHRMGSYIKPHKHKNKAESFHIIEGALLIILFDNDGDVVERFSMDDIDSGSNLIFRIEKDYWHTMVPLTDYVVFHEVTIGPFTGIDDSIFPDWLPDDKDISGIEKFLEKIVSG